MDSPSDNVIYGVAKMGLRLAATIGFSLAAGCASRQAPFMNPAAGFPANASAERAVIVFAADISPPVGPPAILTFYDENRQFLGELSDHSMFRAEVLPGKHAFAAIDLRDMKRIYRNGEQFPCMPLPRPAAPQLLTFTAELQAGKTYVVWIRWEAMGKEYGARVNGYRLLVPRPNAKLLNPSLAFRVMQPDRGGMFGNDETTVTGIPKPILVPDVPAGQSFLNSMSSQLCMPTIQGAEPSDVRAEDGFDQLPR